MKIQNKNILVNSVFSKVHKKYDVMNDLMSFGIHRLWKKNLIDRINPQKNENVIDVASGTGDLAILLNKRLNGQVSINCVEPNNNMLLVGKDKLKHLKNIHWNLASAEKLPFKNDSFDIYTISFGLRNVGDINKSLKEANRVLKTGGRFFCLEFSKIENEFLNSIYSTYSKLIPKLGKYIVGSSQPYDYLINSINSFYNQDDLLKIIKNNGFEEVEYNNLSNGIVAIHSGWKI